MQMLRLAWPTAAHALALKLPKPPDTIDLFLAEETGANQIEKEECGKETQKKKNGGHEQKQSVGEAKRQREIGRKCINTVQYSTRRKIMWRENRHWKRPKKGEEKEVRTWQGR